MQPHCIWTREAVSDMTILNITCTVATVATALQGV